MPQTTIIGNATAYYTRFMPSCKRKKWKRGKVTSTQVMKFKVKRPMMVRIIYLVTPPTA